MDAHVMRDRDPGVCVQTMPFSGNTVRTHTQASLHAITRDAPFILIIINNIYIYISPFSPRPHAHPHALIFRRCAQYLPVDHAVATKVPAPCSSRACVVRFAQVDMLHVMRGDGVTDRANG